MAELIAKLDGLLKLPSDVHWFCERPKTQQLDAHSTLHGQNEPSCEKVADNTLEDAIQCLQLYAYDDAHQYQEPYTKALDGQLARCDACILGYYKARRRFGETLRHDYDEEPVRVLEQRFDERDLDRIKNALDRVQQKLQTTEPALRKKSALDQSEKMGLFEALCNKALLTDEFLLAKHFQGPFDLVQTNKPLSISYYVPATAIFLFGKHFARRKWATSAWSKFSETPSKEDFDFAIRDALLSNMQSVVQWDQSLLESTHLARVWSGIGIILERLNNDLVTHSLRALEIDVFLMALDHLRHDVPSFRQLIQTIRKLLDIAPKDLWDAMGPMNVSPTTFIDQIFSNPQYDKIVGQAKESEDTAVSPLEDMLSWIKPFMSSLDTIHQARACNSICLNLLGRLQGSRFPQFGRVQCFRAGLATLRWTLGNCFSEGPILTTTGRIAATETLEIVSKYVKEILQILSLSLTDPFQDSCRDLCLKILTLSLALECRLLKTDQEYLNQGKELPESNHPHAPAVWDAVVLNMDRGNIAVAKAALVAVNDLTGLEKFQINAKESYSKEKSGFNVKFGRLTHLVCQILERINDFRPRDLDELFRHSESATALLSSLFSADANLYEAGVNLIKSISGESARKEALGHLLNTFLTTTLNALSWSVGRIARNKTYASCPRMLKTSADVLDILCNSQDGLLRTRELSDVLEIKALEDFWQIQWESLWVVYEMTESWSKNKVADTEVLREFCRDTMQFSEYLFDQYSIFANAINSVVKVKSEGNSACNGDELSELLKQPTRILQKSVKWLRLKDLFLVDIAVNLTKKMLRRLTGAAMTVAEEPSQFLQGLIRQTTAARKLTNLTPQQKAELARALEENLGYPISSVQIIDLDSPSNTEDSREHSRAPVKTKKATTIDLDSWRNHSKQPERFTEISDDDYGSSDVLDSELASISRSIELMDRMKADQTSLTSRQQIKAQDAKTGRAGFALKTFQKRATAGSKNKATEMASFREKREREQQAKKKRDADALVHLKRKAAGVSEISGVRGLGMKGKDHTPKGPSMMVSSGSDSESEDGVDHDLFEGIPKIKAPSDSRYYDAGKPMPDRTGPVKKIRQARSAKDMRARLAPDLTQLHKTILSWDFFHDGDFPPGADRQDYSFVTNTFRTPIDYQNVFEPLLILEAWQGILKSKDEGNFKTFDIKVSSRMNVDSFVELSTTMPLAEGKELGIGEADVVLISKSASPTKDSNQPHCFARVDKINRKKGVMEITCKTNVGNPLVAAMVPNSLLYGAKIESITPLEREYGALLGLKYFDLCDEITRAKPSPLLAYTDSQLGPLVDIYEVNLAQAKAIRSAIDNDAFTLIQGPPGSGKTKTIVAIVGALLSRTLAGRDRGAAIARPVNDSHQRVRNGETASKKLLVCAPSNAAVDELVMRFKDGVKTISGTHEKLNIVRLGRSDAVNANILDVTLDELVNAKLNLAGGRKTGSGEELQKVMIAHKATCERYNKLRDTVDALKASGQKITPEQDHEFEVLRRKKTQLSSQIDQARDSGDTVARDAEISRRRAQQEVLDNSHVICATLSGSGHEMFRSLNIEFETVVIDEAAQSIELSALIPLKYGCSKCILVGDPKQLPPTVLSREAARFQYEQSLFVRMQANHPRDVHLLDTQYRMHPEISLFPSAAFYESKLLDGSGMANLRRRPWHQSDMLGPYRFFDVLGTHQSAPRGHSLINIAEVEVALKLYARLTTDCRGYDFSGKIGIITPYKSQLRELRSRFASRYGDDIFSTIEFNTTDAFQGRESEIIIFSCVRASLNKGIGFLSDIRRMNVGITRAKSSLWVLGNSRSLTNGEFWGRLIQDAKDRNRFTGGDLAAILSKPLLDPRKLATPLASGDHDIEMHDADTRVNGNATAQNRLNSKATTVREGLPSGRQISAYRPSGGITGFDEKQNCGRCGSFAHITSKCDDTEALGLSGNLCYRCGKPGCHAKTCEELKCVICGELGHTKHYCTNKTPLPKKDQNWLRKVENERTLRLAGHETEQTLADAKRRQRIQLGDHDKPVPVVQSNSKNGEILKRKRSSSSPPLDVSKELKHSSTALRLGRKLLPGQAQPPHEQNMAYQPPPKSHSSAQSSKENVNATRDPATKDPPSKLSSNTALPTKAGSYEQSSKTKSFDRKPNPDVSIQPHGSGNTIIKLGEKGSSDAWESQHRSSLQDMKSANVRAPKPKREVDPFIRRKKK